MDVGKLLKTAPVKREFAPSLPQLLAPRIDSLPRTVLRIKGIGTDLHFRIAAIIITAGESQALQEATS